MYRYRITTAVYAGARTIHASKTRIALTYYLNSFPGLELAPGDHHNIALLIVCQGRVRKVAKYEWRPSHNRQGEHDGGHYRPISQYYILTTELIPEGYEPFSRKREVWLPAPEGG